MRGLVSPSEAHYGGPSYPSLRVRYGGPSYPSWGPTMGGLAPLLGGIMGGPPSTKGPPQGHLGEALPGSFLQAL